MKKGASEFIEYCREHPEFSERIDNAAQEAAQKVIEEAGFSFTREEYLSALKNRKLSDDEIAAISGGFSRVIQSPRQRTYEIKQ